MSKLMEIVLQRRGMDAAALEEIENPEHKDLHDIDVLCEKLRCVHDDGRKIVVLPDYDMDGIMSGTIGYAGLSELGFDVELFIPNPVEGYGFGAEQIDRLVEEHPGVQTIITCDTGIGCREGTEYAKSLGLEVLVTDHHMEDESASPRGIADVIVDPCGQGETYEHPAICGAHVLWQCLDYYARQYETEEKINRIWALRAFAGIGTISDVMPVLYENRSLVRDAWEQCRMAQSATDEFVAFLDGTSEGYRQAFRGLWAAFKVLSNNKKMTETEDIDERLFGFYLSPVFNAVKRMDGDMSRAFGVFTDTSPVKDMEYLYELNEERKKIVAEEVEKINSRENPLAPYCYITDGLPGIFGLLATKLSVANGLPCIIVGEKTNGGFAGSGRSPEWYPFLSRAGEKGFSMAGHEGAFGCRFKDREELEALVAFLSEDVPVIAEEATVAEVSYDVELANDGNGDFAIDEDAFMEFVEDLDNYRPFGRGFEEPTFMLRFDAADAAWGTMGRDGTHLKLVLDSGLEILCWGQADVIANGNPTGEVRIIGKLGINDFRGQRNAQFVGDVLDR